MTKLFRLADVRERVRLQMVSDDPRAREIAELYWEQDPEGAFVYRVAEIAETYGLNGRQVREVINVAAIAESEDRLCGVCGAGYRMASRQDATSVGGPREIVCDECRVEQEEERRHAERRMIADQYLVPEEASPLLVAGLKLVEAVGLYAVIRQCSDEQHRRILPVAAAGERIAPHEYVWQLLRDLHESILWVDPDSDPGAFVWESGSPDRFYLERVSWKLAGDPEELGSVSSQLAETFKAKSWPTHWEHEAPHLQRLLAAQELAAYFVRCLEEHHLSISPGERTWEVLNAMADSRPIGSGYNLIWRAARDAAAFMVRENCSTAHAAAWGVSALRRSFEKAESQAWTLSPFSRHWGLPRSEMTHIFFELFLGESDEMITGPLPLPTMNTAT